jgi:hypothetical protein
MPVSRRGFRLRAEQQQIVKLPDCGHLLRQPHLPAAPGAAAQLKNLFDVHTPDTFQVSSNVPEGTAQNLLLESRVQRFDRRGGKRDATLNRAGHSIAGLFGQRMQQIPCFPHRGGFARNGFHKARIEVPLQIGNQFQPDSVPGVRQVPVGRIFAIGALTSFKVLENELARAIQQGAHKVPSDDRVNRRKSLDTASPQQPEKDRFRLVVLIVPDSHPVRTRLPGRAPKERVPFLPRGLFQIPLLAFRAAPNVNHLGIKCQSPFFSRAAYKILVSIAFPAPKGMVKVGDIEFKAQDRLQGIQAQKECHGIGASRYGGKHTIPGPDHPVFPDCPQDTGFQEFQLF